MNTNPDSFDVATITLNPAVDRTVTISNFAPGTVNRIDSSHDLAGGKGVNVASALAASGFRTAATGFLGRENAGIFEALFADRHIADRFVRISGPTRIGIKINDPVRKLTTDINFPGQAPAPGDFAKLLDALSVIASPWWVLAGSLPPGLEPAIYRKLILALKKRGALVALDASGDALREAIEAGPHIIKPNLDELRTLLGRRLHGTAAIVKAARKLLEKGIQLVVVSMGADGACFVTETDALFARNPEVDVRTTVGAGDAMLAGIVTARLRALPLADCARLSSAFAIHALTGADSQTLEKTMQQIMIEKSSPHRGRSLPLDLEAPRRSRGRPRR